MPGVFEEQKDKIACDLRGHREPTLVMPCLLLQVRREAIGKLGTEELHVLSYGCNRISQAAGLRVDLRAKRRAEAETPVRRL